MLVDPITGLRPLSLEEVSEAARKQVAQSQVVRSRVTIAALRRNRREASRRARTETVGILRR